MSATSATSVGQIEPYKNGWLIRFPHGELLFGSDGGPLTKTEAERVLDDIEEMQAAEGLGR